MPHWRSLYSLANDMFLSLLLQKIPYSLVVLATGNFEWVAFGADRKHGSRTHTSYAKVTLSPCSYDVDCFPCFSCGDAIYCPALAWLKVKEPKGRFMTCNFVWFTHHLLMASGLTMATLHTTPLKRKTSGNKTTVPTLWNSDVHGDSDRKEPSFCVSSSFRRSDSLHHRMRARSSQGFAFLPITRPLSLRFETEGSHRNLARMRRI